MESARDELDTWRSGALFDVSHRFSLTVSVFVLAAMVGIACGGETETRDSEQEGSEPGFDVLGGGKADGISGMAGEPNDILEVNEADSVEGSTSPNSEEFALGYAFELAKGQSVQFTVRSETGGNLNVYGPRTERHPGPVERYQEQPIENHAISGGEPLETAVEASGSGWYLVLFYNRYEASQVTIEWSCETKCAGRQQLASQLENHLEEHGGRDAFELPDETEYDAIPQDPQNPLNAAKVKLGELLFHETGLAVRPENEELGKGTYSCAACHRAEFGFRAGHPQGISEGGSGYWDREKNPNYDESNVDALPIAPPTILNGAYQEVMLWNGQFGSQGLNDGTEDRWERGTPTEWNKLDFLGPEILGMTGLRVHRMSIVESDIVDNSTYVELFNEAFDRQQVEDLADEERLYQELAQRADFTEGYRSATASGNGEEVANYEDEPISDLKAGLAIAAYMRATLANEAPFQKWLRGEEEAMTMAELRGANVFFSEEKGNCVACHSGPALSDGEFHVTGLQDLKGVRTHGESLLGEVTLGRMSFTGEEEDRFAFKTQQLYNLKERAFYGHGSSMTSLEKVVDYMVDADPAKEMVSESDLDPKFEPRDLTEAEREDLLLFIKGGLYDPNLERYQPAELPTGNCPTVADEKAYEVQECSASMQCSTDAYNCGDFNTCQKARKVFDACSGDPHNLDGDGDGIPCASLCTCSVDRYNCSDFETCAEATRVLNACEGDPNGLDGDGNGTPCASLCE